MAKNPYSDPEDLAKLLWETEAVADKYSNAGLILLRTKNGWRGFLTHVSEEGFREFEEELDKNVPSISKSIFYEPPAFVRPPRNPDLSKELYTLLSDICLAFPGYYPLKITVDDNIPGEDEDIPF